ncbi:hypothetical protein ITX31_09045 [Arthrobacter gandavensis]|uniref:hypothetical protein n=1 Tax=Arthrobacter gandavensis TaxID=169960 RepID=UPI00189096B8|nr:hypothetical protein [Arthrobacter gandavensis]MBF4994256.1 hypothetical protein [Arthrobacter gandavensis]
MLRDEETDVLLKSLDAAAPRGAVSERSDRDLERILADDAGVELHPIPSRTRWNRRLVLAGAAAAAAVAILAVPVLGGGDPAYASWTRTASKLSPVASEKAGNACRGWDRRGESLGASVAIAERRGEWTTVVLSGPGGFSSMCVTEGSLFGSSLGYSGKTPGGAEPAARGLLPTAMGMGSTSAGELSMVVGAAGSEVSAVSYASETQGDVSGSVANGYFVLWFPGDELKDYPETGVLLQVSYADGTRGQVRVSLDWANQ